MGINDVVLLPSNSQKQFFGKLQLKLLTIVVGYGNIVPATSSGRIFCAFYAFAGIPLCMLLLINLGAQLYEKCKMAIDHILEKCNIKLTSFIKVIKTAAIVLLLGLAMFLFIPAIVFVHLEDDWSYSDACYFAFITISTIGFGDVVAGEEF